MMRFQHDLNLNRWTAYFDLLGIRDRLARGEMAEVFAEYTKAIEHCQSSKEWSGALMQTWFSDTFLMVAPDDSAESFKVIDVASRFFVFELIQRRIPVRGAISCDCLYADFEERVLFGKALVEAYEYGEAQDWIGLLLCPSASKRLDSLGVVPEARYYVSAEVPWKCRPQTAPTDLTVCVIGNHFMSPNPCIMHLQEMMRRCTDAKAIKKYEVTIAFLERHQRVW